MLFDDSTGEEIVDAVTEVGEEAVQSIVLRHDRQPLDRGQLDEPIRHAVDVHVTVEDRKDVLQPRLPPIALAPAVFRLEHHIIRQSFENRLDVPLVATVLSAGELSQRYLDVLSFIFGEAPVLELVNLGRNEALVDHRLRQIATYSAHRYLHPRNPLLELRGVLLDGIRLESQLVQFEFIDFSADLVLVFLDCRRDLDLLRRNVYVDHRLRSSRRRSGARLC